MTSPSLINDCQYIFFPLANSGLAICMTGIEAVYGINFHSSFIPSNISLISIKCCLKATFIFLETTRGAKVH